MLCYGVLYDYCGMLAFSWKVMGVIACKVCTLVIVLKQNGGQLGVYSGSLWNHVNSATSFEFYSHGVLPPVWVSVVVIPFSSRSLLWFVLQFAM